MVFFFLIFCFSISLLFFLPPPLLGPFKQGLSLFSFLLATISFGIEKFSWTTKYRTKWNQIFREPFAKSRNAISISVGVSLVIIGFLFHGYQLTVTFADTYQFHDADYVGMQEVIRNMMRGNGYLSPYYSASGEDSYLTHHFAPALFFFLPFEWLAPARWGYAVGVYFYLCLGSILWIWFLYRVKSNEMFAGRMDIFYLLAIALLGNLYIYRLGTSYHFEVLVYPLSAVFFYYFDAFQIHCAQLTHSQDPKRITIFIGFILSLLLLLMVKEDIAGYVVLFLLPAAVTIFMKIRRSNPNSFSFVKTIQSDAACLSLLTCFLYFGFVFLILPLMANAKSENWFGALTSDYPSDYKKVTGIGKSTQIFMELTISSGFGILTNISSALGLVLIYLTHALSTRPWHHEVYSYYCYTILPFLLYAGIIWQKEKKTIPIWAFFLLLTLLFVRNTRDVNFPIKIDQIQLTPEEQLRAEEVTADLTTVFKEHPLHPNRKIYSQYNLSFFMPERNVLYPLSQMDQKEKVCEQNGCYLVIAPKFTQERLVPSEFIIEKRESFATGTKIFQGKWVEVWESN